MKRAAALSALLLSVVACSIVGGPAPSPRPSTSAPAILGDIRIGALFPTSGSSAASGVAALHGVELAADVLNGLHPEIGLPRLTVGRIVLDASDTRGDAQTAAAEVDRLTGTDHVVALTGALQSAVTAAASARADRRGVPMVSGSASATDLTERSLRWFWRVGPSDRTYAETYFRWLEAVAKQHAASSMVVVHANDQAGTDGAALVRQLGPQHQVDIAEDMQFPPNATDLAPQVLRLSGYAPDAVFVFASIGDATLLVRTMAQLGYTPPALLAFGSSFTDPRFAADLGPWADYVITQSAWSPEVALRKPVARAVADAFRQKYGSDLTEDSTRDFEAMLTLGMAIQAADSTDPALVRTALTRTDVKATIMAWEGIRFDSKGQNALARGVIEQITNGRYHVLYPADVASTSLTWPMPPLNRR